MFFISPTTLSSTLRTKASVLNELSFLLDAAEHRLQASALKHEI